MLCSVQIPLWTIVTWNAWLIWNGKHVQIPLWTIVTAPGRDIEGYVMGSDSSMDDCNSP